MAQLNDGEILERIQNVDPKLAARTLIRLAGKNARANEILGYIYANAMKGDQRAISIAECLTAAVHKILVEEDKDAIEGVGLDIADLAASASSLVPTLGAFLPTIIKSGAKLLSSAKAGDPKAEAKVKNVIATAKKGDPKALKALGALKAANALTKKAIPVPHPPPPKKVASGKPAPAARGNGGLYIPSWNDENGRSIRGAPTGVLVDMRQKGIDFKPYGNTSAQTIRALQPMVEEELRTRGKLPNDGLIAEAKPTKKWWQGSQKAIDLSI